MQVYGEEVGSGLMIFYLFLAFSGFLLVSLIVTILYITFANKVGEDSVERNARN